MSDDNDKYPCAGWSVLHARGAKRMIDMTEEQITAAWEKADAELAMENALGRIAQLEAAIRHHRDDQGDYANSVDRDLYEVLKELGE